MTVHSISILSQTKQYVNLPTELLTKIRQLFGPSIATAWEVIYTESRGTKGAIMRSYDYLASKIGCSRRTILRYVKKMSQEGLLIIRRRFHHKCNLCNEFVLLTPEEALIAAKESEDRIQPIKIDYSVDYSVENQNSVDKSVSFCHPSILSINQDINKTPKPEPKTAIAGLRQGETKEREVENEKSISQAVLNTIKKIVSSTKHVSNPSELLDEAVYFVSHRKRAHSEWQATGAFKKLMANNLWSTPYSMRKGEE